jgi:aerobic carbon-monoxide dehydrogenase medium subunit
VVGKGIINFFILKNVNKIGGGFVHNLKFIRPNSIQEVSKVLAEQAGKVMLAAGCTDIIPALRRKVIAPEIIVSLKGVSNLSYIIEDSSVVRIGALTTMTEIAESDVIKNKFPALAIAAGNVGSRLVQNSATIAGNLCNASPAADTAPPLLVYGAILKIFNQGEEREVDLAEFFVGYRQILLKPGDVVQEIILSTPDVKSVSTFVKHGKRKALEISIVSVAVNLTLGDKGEITEAAIAWGAVGATPALSKTTVEKLNGLVVKSEEDLTAVIETLATEVSPISDIRSTGEYRKQVVAVLTRRAIYQLVSSAKGV